MNFELMAKTDGKVHVYVRCYADLMLGGGIAGAYIQHQAMVFSACSYLESATINQLELQALQTAICHIKPGVDVVFHTCNRYIFNVLVYIEKWAKDGSIETRPHAQILKPLNYSIEALGACKVIIHTRKGDDLLIHLEKWAKHLYSEVQREMIQKRSTNFEFIRKHEIKNICDGAGEIIWKTPLSVSQFEKRMIAARSTKGDGKLRLVAQEERV